VTKRSPQNHTERFEKTPPPKVKRNKPQPALDLKRVTSLLVGSPQKLQFEKVNKEKGETIKLNLVTPEGAQNLAETFQTSK